ncbi:MAG TPA: distant relative of cell wall-associated hydrolase [Burkholderiales bacterium]|nr:distant relative of cell wall-associated hydrolase [Burkholderiales bacterium]
MERWNLGNMGLGSTVVAALLLPGGILLLAWVLYRRYGSRLAGRWVALAALIAALQGCATQLAIRPAPGPDDQDAASTRQVLLFQSSSIAPKNNDAPLLPEGLRQGDIILTSDPGFVSASIQLMTLAPVSHAAIYIGDGKVVEAVRPAVRVRALDEVMAEGTVVLAFRHPELSTEQARNISNYALQKTGTGFNYFGVTLHVPFSITRRLCELPLLPSPLRDACLRGIGALHYLAAAETQTFCSQLVLDAYRQAGVPITDADPRLISPADILHMREGDVSSVRIHKSLRYVGHLKYVEPTVIALQQ